MARKNKVSSTNASPINGRRGAPLSAAPQHEFYQSITDVLHRARSRAYQAVNVAMVEAYWNIGRILGRGRMALT